MKTGKSKTSSGPDPQPPPHLDAAPPSLSNLAKLFLKLGVIGFGGPAAHIALMEDEVVQRRRWLDPQEFLDLLGATNLIPGPTSTEMSLHIGLRQRGFPGMCVAGGCFILPSALLTMALAWVYVRYGALPETRDILAGIQGAVVALIATACITLGRAAAKNGVLIALGIAAAVASFAGLPEIAVLVSIGIVGLLAAGHIGPGKTSAMLPGALGFGLTSITGTTAAATGTTAALASGATTIKLGFGFLGIGSILYGSGYVLFSFLDDWLVTRTGWLTYGQLTDAIAVGQFTPGPVSTTATFIGYILTGGPGAIAATIGMFLPSFVFVWLLSPWLPRMRQSPRASGFLDAVNIAAVALIGVVTIRLGYAVTSNWLTPLLAVIALVLLLKKWITPTWLILGAGLIGWVAGTLDWI